MNPRCPNQSCRNRNYLAKNGFFYRKSDSKHIQKYICKACKTNFSQAVFSENYRQNRRRLNPLIFKLYNSGVSQRRMALILGCNLKTVARKFRFLSLQARNRVLEPTPRVKQIQFDEMEAWEHTKLKPVSIIVAVDKATRSILSLRVSSMSAKGQIAKEARKKYGKRRDDRRANLDEVFSNLKAIYPEIEQIESDQNPMYPRVIRKFYPDVRYERHKGRRGCVVGQGELKRGGYDPLFSLNHTCAMIRANVNRLFRRTWNTTKKIEALQLHLDLYMQFHNQYLVKN